VRGLEGLPAHIPKVLIVSWQVRNEGGREGGEKEGRRGGRKRGAEMLMYLLP